MTSEFNFFFATTVGILLVLSTVMVHYEALRLISLLLPRLKMQPRVRILAVIYGVIFAHTIEVWIFAFAYYFLSEHMELGAFTGLPTSHIFDYVYFSVVVYTSLGFGDLLPLQHVRLIAGMEALLGLVMIGWSASFTYLMMERFWKDHPGHPNNHQSKKEPPP
jgi:hypothetical protein